MITDKKLIAEFKTLLIDPYVFYCGEGMAFDKARSKTVEEIFNIPYCFSILGILKKAGYIQEIYIDAAKGRGELDEMFLKEYGEFNVLYIYKEDLKPIAALYDCCKYIKYFGSKDDIEFETMQFDHEDNKAFSRKSNLMMNLLKNILSEDELVNIMTNMRSTMKFWKDQDELYNMMY